ncbi:serine hydrolase, partial [Clostridium perfringens]|uniref:serine hydrolase n=1 Tax=Clostridium perfringens TaxID=1502 RepID=UPI002AC5FAC6
AYNGDEYYVAASTTKIPLAMSVADDVYNGEYSMDTEIKYSYDDYEEGTGILWQEDYIAPITVDDAIYLSIVYSDNIAKNMLRRISTISTNDYISNITGNVSLINDENKYTANQLGEVLKKLYLNEEKNPYYDNILEYMSETVFHDRIDKYLPYYNVAHKIGTYYRYYHDIGIIYA